MPGALDIVTRILFIPEVEEVRTSERTPYLYRALRSNHHVVGLPARWDRFLYDPSRAKWPRYLLWPLDKMLLSLRGVRVARRHGSNLVFCETAHHALVGLVIARILGIRCVWDSHGNIRLFSESLGKGMIYSYLAGSLERFLGRRVDVLVTVSDKDAEAYAQMGVHRSRIQVVPLFVDLSEIDAGVAVRSGRGHPDSRQGLVPRLLFFGSFRYSPNCEALEFINRVLAPALERKGIRCEIWIAGRDLPQVKLHPSIRALGFVPDIHECIRSADLCIVPVWRGVGTLTKVLDIMAAGTPLVMSGFAADGVQGALQGVHAFIARSAEEFPTLVVEALANPAVSASMANEARRLIERTHSAEVARGLLEEVLRPASA